ncbi:L,D-transpeptidase [Beijerinckia sp. L45]|uniref:L,D-transpeptidase n=1 Tax=Beijerinckia sp. L45 TaxID=1641855 RepID=UPI00131A80F5|nr:L,D-transpeptidase [Beijerinckia sp. L45]
MRRVAVVCAFVAPLALALPAQATVAVAIDLSHQTMHVTSSTGTYDWPISSGRSGFSTPGGSYAPTHLEAMHYSHKYHMSPMPHAIFFRGGYAIHGTYASSSLGSPASHGCVRLSPGNAAHLYAMVKAEGAQIAISGTPPQGATRYAARPRHLARSEAVSEPNYGYDQDADEAPIRRARDPNPYAAYGYCYVGTTEGHRVYQAAPGYGYAPAAAGLGFPD